MAIFNSYVKLPKGMPHIHIVTFEFSRKVIQYWSPPGRPSTGHHKCATAGPLGPCFTDGYGMGCLHATAAGSLDRWRWRERNRLKKKKPLRVWQPKHFPDHQNHQKMSLDSLWWFYQTISFQMFHHKLETPLDAPLINSVGTWVPGMAAEDWDPSLQFI